MANKSRIPRAQPSEEQRKLQRERATEQAKALQEEIDGILDEIQSTVERLSDKYLKSESFILEQLHLGGVVLKQKHAPGINNAFAHCEARCEDECRSIFWSNPILTNWFIVGKHDPSKEEIREVVNRAQELGGYEQLDQHEKDILIEALEESRAANNIGIVRRPMAQMHDVWAVCNRVCREVSWLEVVAPEITYFF